MPGSGWRRLSELRAAAARDELLGMLKPGGVAYAIADPAQSLEELALFRRLAGRLAGEAQIAGGIAGEGLGDLPTAFGQLQLIESGIGAAGETAVLNLVGTATPAGRSGKISACPSPKCSSTFYGRIPTWSWSARSANAKPRKSRCRPH